ncbi:MAG TPA: hypothetical protein VK644_00200, partial [Chitinophagaceae bacterium]|nr:hypothetical protein [Chitinophagaceae bacterium]
MRTILSMLLIIGISLRLSAQDNSYKEISLPDLMKKKGQEKGLVILDVRTNGEYYDTSGQYKQGNIGRIKGTLHVELQDLLENP